MSSNSRFAAFLRDERGSYTIWSLIWFMMYVAIGGLAVDITDAYRNQTLLQSTADAAALAGVMSLPNEAAVNAAAEGYAASNMPPSVHGTVLKNTEVFIGRWDFDARTFTPGASDPNAVRAIARRSTANANPVLTNFLRIIGLGFWNVHVDAIAASGISKCDRDGFVAGGQLYIRTRNEFWNEICLHGEQGFELRAGGNDVSKNDFETGVQISTGCTDCMNGPPPALAQDDFITASSYPYGGEGIAMPAINAENVESFLTTLETIANNEWTPDQFNTFVTDSEHPENEKYGAWNWIFEGGEPNYLTTWVPPDPDSPTTTVYNLDCSPQFQLEITGTEPISNVVIITNCPVKASSSVNIQNAIIAARVDKFSNWAVQLAAQADLGAANCEGGGVEIYTNGSAHLSAQGETYGTRIVAKGDVQLTAQTSSGDPGTANHYGIAVEAAGDIDMSSGNSFGLCPDGSPPGPRHLRHALVD